MLILRYLYDHPHLLGTSFLPGKLVPFAEAYGNLSLRLVSKAGRTRATSHPCERGAGFLEI